MGKLLAMNHCMLTWTADPYELMLLINPEYSHLRITMSFAVQSSLFFSCIVSSLSPPCSQLSLHLFLGASSSHHPHWPPPHIPQAHQRCDLSSTLHGSLLLQMNSRAMVS